MILRGVRTVRHNQIDHVAYGLFAFSYACHVAYGG